MKFSRSCCVRPKISWRILVILELGTHTFETGGLWNHVAELMMFSWEKNDILLGRNEITPHLVQGNAVEVKQWLRIKSRTHCCGDAVKDLSIFHRILERVKLAFVTIYVFEVTGFGWAGSCREDGLEGVQKGPILEAKVTNYLERFLIEIKISVWSTGEVVTLIQKEPFIQSSPSTTLPTN